jgi:Ferroportin1 (FPN1)
LRVTDLENNVKVSRVVLIFIVLDLNAISRSIDLICKVLSPTVAGFIMSHGSMLASAIVLAVWNVVSVFVEYSILAVVFRRVPELAVKCGFQGVWHKDASD